MEDDGDPTCTLIDSIYDGEYKQILKRLDKYSWDVVFWGRQHKKIDTQKRIDDLIGKPTLFVGWGYMHMPSPSYFKHMN